METIALFEKDVLLGDSRFQKVYLRSLVRAYAKKLSIDPVIALEGLEQALAGSYGNRLAVTYLDEPEFSDTVSPPSNSSSSAIPSPEQAASGSGVQHDVDSPAKSLDSLGKSTVDASKAKHRRAGTMLVVAVGVLVWALVYATGGSDGSVTGIIHGSPGLPTASGSFHLPTVPDSTGLLTVSDSSRSEYAGMARLSPGDSVRGYSMQGNSIEEDPIRVRVVADRGVGGSVRITVDDDTRWSRWMESGDSMRIRFARHVLVRGQVDRVSFYVQGREYPTSHLHGEGSVFMDRDSVQAFLSFPQVGRSHVDP